MKNKIKELFKTINETPLFYVESGSRLWGIASPDSDFDVRGFHIQSKEQYFDFKNHRDIVELMDGDFDFVSYDIDKMFGLLLKSNPTVFEWIRSNIIYINSLTGWEDFQNDLILNFDFKALFHHYISLAKTRLTLMQGNKFFTYKSVFYCIRGLLSAELASMNVIPELHISDLFNQFENDNEILKIAKDSLEKKKQHTEKEEVLPDEKGKILRAVNEFITYLETKTPNKANNKKKLEKVLFDYSFNLKSNFYR